MDPRRVHNLQQAAPTRVLTDNDRMPFGKFGPGKGDHRIMKDVPVRYLLWLWEEGGLHARSTDPVHHYIRRSFKALEMECPDYIVKHRP